MKDSGPNTKKNLTCVRFVKGLKNFLALCFLETLYQGIYFALEGWHLIRIGQILDEGRLRAPHRDTDP